MRGILLWLLLGFVFPLLGQEGSGGWSLPSKPANGIHDPGKWLTRDVLSELEGVLKQAREEWKVEVFLVVMPSEPVIGRVAFAKRIESEWVVSGVWGVVFHFLDDENSPYFHAARGGRPSWNDEQVAKFDAAIETMIVEVGERADRAGGVRQGVRLGTRELAEELWYLGTVMDRNTREFQRMRGEMLATYRHEFTRRAFLKKVLMAAIPLVVLAIGVGIYWLRVARKKKRVGYLFPTISPQVRFLAPWSGGNDVLVNFAAKIGKDGSRKG